MSNKLREIKTLIENEVGYPLDKNSRKREVVMARALYYKIARDLYSGSNKLTLRKIGEELGKDHATVLHGLRKVSPFVLKDTYFNNVYKSVLHVIDKSKYENFSESEAENERLKSENISLRIENNKLQQAIDRMTEDSDEFFTITYGLSEVQLGEIYNKIRLMAKMMKSANA